jgi:hypothetical protein
MEGGSHPAEEIDAEGVEDAEHAFGPVHHPVVHLLTIPLFSQSTFQEEREFFVDNLLVRIHFIIVM